MKKTKITGLILCALLACGSLTALTGCGGNDGSASGTEPSSVSSAVTESAVSEIISSQEPVITLTSLAGTGWTVKDVTVDGKTMTYADYCSQNGLNDQRSTIEFISDTEAALCDYKQDGSRVAGSTMGYTLAANGTLTFDNTLTDAVITGDQMKCSFNGMQLTLERDAAVVVPSSSESSSSSSATSSEASSVPAANAALNGTSWTVTKVTQNGKTMTFKEYASQTNNTDQRSAVEFISDTEAAFCDYKANGTRNVTQTLKYTLSDDGKLSFNNEQLKGGTVNGNEMTLSFTVFDLTLTKD